MVSTFGDQFKCQACGSIGTIETLSASDCNPELAKKRRELVTCLHLLLACMQCRSQLASMQYIYVSSAQDRLQKLRDELAQRKSERLYEQQKGKAVPSSAPRGVLVAIKSDLVLYGAPKTLSCMHIYMRCSD